MKNKQRSAGELKMKCQLQIHTGSIEVKGRVCIKSNYWHTDQLVKLLKLLRKEKYRDGNNDRKYRRKYTEIMRKNMDN